MEQPIAPLHVLDTRRWEAEHGGDPPLDGLRDCWQFWVYYPALPNGQESPRVQFSHQGSFAAAAKAARLAHSGARRIEVLP